ncbi:MAG: sigma-70 family RNA polymerase sigma factor [Opitutae bacterium]|nr:sigma-70 family RNA polymerase sigma factor [Opitutae bacterium]
MILTPSSLHDAELVRRFQAGDESAFGEIAARHRDRLLAIAQRYLGNRADAEEIAQDTLLHAYRGLASFRGESSLASWLHRIASNLSCNRYWYFHRRRRHVTQALDSRLGPGGTSCIADFIASEAPDPARMSIHREFLAEVTASMQRLSPLQREILSRRNLSGHSYARIAREFGICIGTVKSRLARARGSVRKLLAEKYAAPEVGAPNAAQWFEPHRLTHSPSDAAR